MIIDLEYITCQITTLEGINMTKIKTLKIAVAFGLAMLLGASLLASASSLTKHGVSTDNNAVIDMINRSKFTVGAGPWP
jgi:hypothetical protein